MGTLANAQKCGRTIPGDRSILFLFINGGGRDRVGAYEPEENEEGFEPLESWPRGTPRCGVSRGQSHVRCDWVTNGTGRSA
jgi:hypothetical protein